MQAGARICGPRPFLYAPVFVVFRRGFWFVLSGVLRPGRKLCPCTGAAYRLCSHNDARGQAFLHRRRGSKGGMGNLAMVPPSPLCDFRQGYFACGENPGRLQASARSHLKMCHRHVFCLRNQFEPLRGSRSKRLRRFTILRRRMGAAPW